MRPVCLTPSRIERERDCMSETEERTEAPQEKLTAKERAFVEEYLVDGPLNKEKAMSTEPGQVQARSSSPEAERMRLYRKRRREGCGTSASRYT
jgi:hypothetical protein